MGEGDPGFVRTGFLQLVPPAYADALRANVAAQQRIGIPTALVGPDEVARIVPGMVVDDVVVAAYEPESGLCGPDGDGRRVPRRRPPVAGAVLAGGVRVTRVRLDGDRVAGVETDRGRIDAPVVVDAAGAWAAELARTAGLEIPVQAWRHDTAYFGLPGRAPRPDIPIVIDHARGGLLPAGGPRPAAGRPRGRQRDRRLAGPPAWTATTRGHRSSRWSSGCAGACRGWPTGDFRTAHGGQDGITPDQRADPRTGRPGRASASQCGFSGTGFKTAPAIGRLHGGVDPRRTAVDGGHHAVRARTASPRAGCIEGEHPYEALWR